MTKGELVALLSGVDDDAQLILFPFDGPRAAGGLQVVQVERREVVDGIEFRPSVTLKACQFR